MLFRSIAREFVLFLGRKTEDKGVGRLLEAWPRILSEFPSATLVIVGPDRLPASPEARTPGVIEIADASEREKHESLAACDLLCVPSIGESFGLAAFEAGSHGKPVVVADVPALRDTVGAAGAGVLVAPEPTAIGEAVAGLLREPATRALMGERGRRLAAEMTHERALEDYLDAYRFALARRAGLAATPARW